MSRLNDNLKNPLWIKSIALFLVLWVGWITEALGV